MKSILLPGLVAALPAFATTYNWIGGAEGSWNVAANWEQADDPTVHAVPSSWQDTANISDAGGSVVITCAAWMEPALVFGANVTFYVPEGMTATQKGAHSGTGNITKTGPGKLALTAGNSSRVGWTYINEGTVSFGGERMLGANGGCVIGDGEHDAVLEAGRDNNWPARFFGPNDGSGDITIKNRGVLAWNLSNKNTYGANINNLSIEEGGEARMGSHVFTALAKHGMFEIAGDMTFLNADSTVGNGTFKMLSSELRVSGTRASTFVLPCNVTSQYQYDNGYFCAKLSAAGGNGLEVDFHVLGSITDAWDARDGLDIKGPGTVKLSGSGSTYGGDVSNQGNTRVQSGRLLVDNAEGSGTGYSKVVVSAGATLGGIGSIGGLATDKTYSGRSSASASTPCVVVNGAAGNPGVLAPGSYEDTTNARIYGTLTVGSAEQPSSVTMNANTKLAFEAGRGGATGLKVYGPLALGSNVSLDVDIRDDAKSGDYVLVSATEGITGDYALTGNAPSSKIVRTENEILLMVRKGLGVFIR